MSDISSSSSSPFTPSSSESMYFFSIITGVEAYFCLCTAGLCLYFLNIKRKKDKFDAVLDREIFGSVSTTAFIIAEAYKGMP